MLSRFYTGKVKKDANCTVQLTGDGNVIYTAGNQVHSFKVITGFPYAKSGPANADSLDVWLMLMSGGSAEPCTQYRRF